LILLDWFITFQFLSNGEYGLRIFVAVIWCKVQFEINFLFAVYESEIFSRPWVE